MFAFQHPVSDLNKRGKQFEVLGVWGILLGIALGVGDKHLNDLFNLGVVDSGLNRYPVVLQDADQALLDARLVVLARMVHDQLVPARDVDPVELRTHGNLLEELVGAVEYFHELASVRPELCGFVVDVLVEEIDEVDDLDRQLREPSLDNDLLDLLPGRVSRVLSLVVVAVKQLADQVLESLQHPVKVALL